MLGLIAVGAVALIAVSAILINKKSKKNDTVKLKSESQIKGEAGENITASEFERFFNSKSEYKILRNVYLKFNDNDTTEIDIIVISEYGIFVVENKNYRGWIFGSFKDNKWTDSYPTGVKFQFYNPLKQNYTHISILKKYIDEKYHNMIYSYVVFNNECELKKVPYNSEFIKIIKSNQIFNTLSKSLKNKCITADELKRLYNNLNQFANISEEEKEKHIEKIRAKM